MYATKLIAPVTGLGIGFVLFDPLVGGIIVAALLLAVLTVVLVKNKQKNQRGIRY